ncbi:MAG: M48 family metallopeptidase [Flavobacteriales bacterium]
MHQLKLGEITVDVVQKNIKNVHLSVYPPTGRVRIAAPDGMKLDTIRIYAISKLSWIKKQQTRFRNQEREAPRDYISRESHYYNGKRFLMRVIEVDGTPKVLLKNNRIELHVRPGTSKLKRQLILENWYRERLKEKIAEYVSEWEVKMRLSVAEFGVKKMKTKWGSCNTDAKRIWLNLELAKKPSPCLEYIVVHEMVHLIERSHNERFIALMNKYMPQWRKHKDELNRLPVRHEEWGY